MKNKTYTIKEISDNISTLTKALEDAKLRRKEINSQIRSINNQIKHWEELDPRQYKMFN